VKKTLWLAFRLPVLVASTLVAACAANQASTNRTSAPSPLSATGVAAAVGPKAAGHDVPLRDFFKQPDLSMFQLSPDGKYIAHVEPWERRRNVFVEEIGQASPKRITSEKDRDLALYFWKGSSRVVYLKDAAGDENFHVFSTDIQTGSARDVTPFAGVRAELVDELEDHPTDILVGLNKDNKEAFDVYRLNTVSGKLNLIAKNPGHVVSWQTDHAGRLRMAVSSDGVNQSLLYRDTEAAPFKTILTTSFKEHVEPFFFTFDNRQVYVKSNRGRDTDAIFEFDPKTAKETKLVAEPPVPVDVWDLAYSRKRKVLTTVEYANEKPERMVLDEITKGIFADLSNKLPGFELVLQSHDLAETKFIVSAWKDTTAGGRYLYDTASKTLTKLAEIAPWLPEAKMSTMQAITYKSRDGLTLHGYLTAPKGIEPKALPLIVHPHGGPWVRDLWGFNPEVQFLASRGYAVLQVNYRGSTGYGRKFWEASFKQWGKAMQDDLTDGVRYLIAQGTADPKRVAIYGGSYGGYATLAGLAFTPELYAAGVDYVGVSNLFTFMNTIPPYWKPMLDQIHEMVGDPEKDKELLAATSPVLHADRIVAPLFVAQGANDPRVNKAESDQMVAALKKRGVVVEYLVKENEGHGFHNEENQFEFYEKMAIFLEKHLAKKP
jgi:dipeptidyl aminopeptidase/acylaminoacyl peptidase